jgi:hypothetical protein
MGKQPRAWIVDFDSDAVIDFEDVKSRRFGGRFVILAVAAKKKDFDRAVAAASDRLKRRG